MAKPQGMCERFFCEKSASPQPDFAKRLCRSCRQHILASVPVKSHTGLRSGADSAGHGPGGPVPSARIIFGSGTMTQRVMALLPALFLRQNARAGGRSRFMPMSWCFCAATTTPAGPSRPAVQTSPVALVRRCTETRNPGKAGICGSTGDFSQKNRAQRRPISASAWASEAGRASSRARPFGRSRGVSSCCR